MKLPSRYYRMYPINRPAGYQHEDLALDPTRTAFVLVDVYGKGYDEDGDVGNQPDYGATQVRDNRETVVDRIKPALDATRRAGIEIVYVTNYLSPGLTEKSTWRELMIRMRGVDVLEAWKQPSDLPGILRCRIAPNSSDHLVRKQMFSGFFETHLYSLLRSLDIRDLVLVGFDSRVCLRTTAIDAMYRNYRVITLRDCIGTYEYEETHEGRWASFIALRELETFCGYTSTANDWMIACAKSQRVRNAFWLQWHALRGH